jgi:hypothetical protein
MVLAASNLAVYERPEAGPEKLAVLSEGRLLTLKGVKTEWESDGIESQLDIVDGIKHDVERTLCGGSISWILVKDHVIRRE